MSSLNEPTFTSTEICRLTGIRRSQLEYLLREYYAFPVNRKGSGRARVFNEMSIQFIKRWLNNKIK